jgi:hypothetical protein
VLCTLALSKWGVGMIAVVISSSGPLGPMANFRCDSSGELVYHIRRIGTMSTPELSRISAELRQIWSCHSKQSCSLANCCDFSFVGLQELILRWRIPRSGSRLRVLRKNATCNVRLLSEQGPFASLVLSAMSTLQTKTNNQDLLLDC